MDSNSVICMKTFNDVFLKTIETPLMHFYHSTDDRSIIITTKGRNLFEKCYGHVAGESEVRGLRRKVDKMMMFVILRLILIQ